MAACDGTREKHRCASTLYRCKKCGIVGCAQGRQGACTSQAFAAGKCVKCGASGQREVFK
jgi:hypothetical protein